MRREALLIELEQLESRTRIYPSQALISIALLLKSFNRKAKGKNFYALAVNYNETNLLLYNKQSLKFVFDTYRYSTPVGKKTATEFTYILIKIFHQLNSGKITRPTRIQFLVKQGEHWTLVDLYLNPTDKKKYKVFILDAAGDERCLNIVTEISKIFDKPIIYICRGGIQFDTFSCSFFALYHAFKISLINEFYTELESQSYNILWPDFASPLYKVDWSQLKPILIAPMQSISDLNSYLTNTSDDPLVKKTLSLRSVYSSYLEVAALAPLHNPILMLFKTKQLNQIREFLASKTDTEINSHIALSAHQLLCNICIPI